MKPKKETGEDKEKDQNGDAEFPKGSIHADTLKCIIKLWHSVTFLLIPVGLFRCSSLGIQGHHYQNLQKLLSVIILHSTAPMCVGMCVYVSLTRLGSNLCFTSFGF